MMNRRCRYRRLPPPQMFIVAIAILLADDMARALQ
jgi:hypothetical protein